MRTPRAVLTTLLGAGTMAISAALAPTAASAASTADGAGEAHAAAVTATDQQRVADYWTDARMRDAIPREKAANPAPSARPRATSAASAVQVPATPRFGKVFFTDKGANYVCSGTVTASTNQSVVTTAGHCVNQGPGAYVTNFAFVPAYDNGARPYGTWTARALVATSQWQSSGDINHDVGFAVMNTNAGRTLTAVTGSYPIAFNLGYTLAFDAYGYPAASPYNGQLLYRCSGTTGRDTLGGSSDHRLPCSMTGGSSGGGWITGGRLNSLNSFGYQSEKDVMYGPYFGSVEQSTFGVAQTR